MISHPSSLLFLCLVFGLLIKYSVCSLVTVLFMMSHIKLFLEMGVGEIPVICSRGSPVLDLSSRLEREREGEIKEEEF